ncbi:MAG TPA: hypothetical protein VIP70_07375 [Nitrososphaeraceae archaeon]
MCSVRKGVKIGVIAAVVIIVGVGAYYLASPLFIPTEVDEPLPGLTTNLMTMMMAVMPRYNPARQNLQSFLVVIHMHS